MTIVPFDTLKLSRKLESGGFTHDQANAAAEALAEAMSGAELATKSDLKTAIEGLRIELTAELASKADLAALRAEFKADFATKSDLKNEIELVKRDLTIRTGSMFIIAVGIILAAMRMMLP